MSKPNPVIVIPGITATYLKDQYPLPPETVWSVMKQDYSRVALHPDNLVYEAQQPARVVSDQLYEIAYKELVEELKYNLRKAEDDPVPVFTFGYDWRHPLDLIEQQLADFIEEVIDRTSLMRNYHPVYAENPKVNLVGHSMGGLIIAGYLDRYRNNHNVDKIATLASPFQGSFEAVIKITTGTANLGTKAPSSREREAARLTPSLYHLMPSFAHGLQVAPGLPTSLYDPAIWQSSILDTICEFIRLHGVDAKRSKAAMAQQAQEIFSDLLTGAKKHRKRLDNLNLQNLGLMPEDWLCVVGVDAVTRVELQVDAVRGKPDFTFRTSDRRNLWGSGTSDRDRRLTGDGTVPFNGAVPKFLPYESLVCVSPDDYGYWEIGDKVTTSIGGFHGILPNMNMLHRLIVHHFTGRPDKHGNIWGRRPPGVSDSDWMPPIPKLKAK